MHQCEVTSFAGLRAERGQSYSEMLEMDYTPTPSYKVNPLPIYMKHLHCYTNVE
jgi:hypothetical protein